MASEGGDADAFDWWLELRHGGQLLDRAGLEALRDPGPLPAFVIDRLRAAITALPAGETPEGEPLATLLDVVLEDVCGLKGGWQKGSDLGAAAAEKLLDGTALKPRRRWHGPNAEPLPVFTFAVTRLGVGRGKRSVAQVTEYLRRRGVPLGVATNGREWRLVWADPDNTAWAEWDTDRFLAGDHASPTLRGLRRVLRPETLAGPLLAAIREARRGQGRLSKELGERVRQAVELLLRSRREALDPVWNEHRPTDVYAAACHFIMRFVVLLFAEARELLPRDQPVYHRSYGLGGLLEALDRAGDRRRGQHAAWFRLLALFRLVHQGSPHPALVLPAYGGELFAPGRADGDGLQRALAVIESLKAPPDDDVVYRLLVLLTRTSQRVRDGGQWRRVAAPVDFTELSSEYIGILYEGLLDYELKRAEAEPVLFLRLGDQPALPLDRLERMDDKAIAGLVEKVKKGDRKAEPDDEVEEEEAPEEPDEAPADEQTPDDEPEVEEVADDERARARTRAAAWAARAALVGGLVKMARGKKADAAQLEAAARSLIGDVKLPGELYLVRWGGTRKGAGTFYTRPQLTLPTVRRTLEPLVRDAGGAWRTPEDILALKVCDPAMGSGSFLVAALRVLTDAVVQALHAHGRLTPDGDKLRIVCDTFVAGDRVATEEQLPALVRRYVVEHCLYGVDLDPLAVELARVALWVETLDRKLPFTFLDHKLRCGDSLVGCWFDRFRDYPLLAWARKTADEKHRGVHHAPKTWATALQARKAAVFAEQADLLSGQIPAYAPPEVSDAAVAQAAEDVRALWSELRLVPAADATARATFWRERIDGHPAVRRLWQAFDTWCALWFWPLDRLGDAPGPRTWLAPSGEAAAIAALVARQARFFHWELAFPDVFTAPGSGFDAVVGNPPWETQKPNSLEFFSNLDPLYRTYRKKEAEDRQRELFAARAEDEAAWLAYQDRLKAQANFVRNAGAPFGEGETRVTLARGRQGELLAQAWAKQRARRTGFADPAHPFLHQGSADLNTYKMFLEAGRALLREGGRFSLLVPSGVYTDLGAKALRALLLDRSRWTHLYAFQNERFVFDGIHHSFKMAVVTAEKGGRTETLRARFRIGPGDSPALHEAEADLRTIDGYVDVDRAHIAHFSPESLSLLEIRSARDLALLTRLYSTGHRLGDADGWAVAAGREFHMTDDAALFPSRDRWEARGYQPDAYGRWIGPDGDVALPFCQGVMIGQFDFSQKGWLEGTGLRAKWRVIDWQEKAVEPQFLMASVDATKPTCRLHKPVIRRIARNTDARMLICGWVPGWPGGDVVPGVVPSDPALRLPLVGVLNAFVVDALTRQRCGGTHVDYHYIAELPLPPPASAAVLRLPTARLAAAHIVFAPDWLALDLDRRTPWKRLWALSPHERLRLRAMLDAIVAALYGLDRDDFRWILRDCDHPVAWLNDKKNSRSLDPKGFWRVDRDRPPELRHTVLSLVAFDGLRRDIEAAGDRDRGIEAFCARNDGDGWLLPDTLRLADHDLGHDDRAHAPQPVAAALGPRFLDWQLAQTAEESWAECEAHARALASGTSASAAHAADGGAAPARAPTSRARQLDLLPSPQLALFGDHSGD